MDFGEKIFRKLEKTPKTKIVVKTTQRPEVHQFYIKKDDKYNYVKQRLINMKTYFSELLGIDKFEAVNHVSDSSFYTYGIIVSPNGCKLDSSSVFISSSIDDSNNVVVRLNVNRLKKYSIFPGQVVVVKGKNLTGREIKVEVLHCMPVVDINAKNIVEDRKNAITMITIVSGPYCLKSEFDALDYVLRSNDSVVVLIGPFFDGTQENFGNSPSFVKSSPFVRRIEDWLDRNVDGNIVLVPSTTDFACLNVFPQSPMKISHNRIHCLGNPGLFFLNNSLFAVSSIDAPLELSFEECFYDSGIENKSDVCGELLFKGDRIGRICHHLIFQRTFLPVFPSANTVSYSIPESLTMDVAPDIYIVVSKLKHFHREAGPSLVINTGSQSKIEDRVFVHMALPLKRRSKPLVEFKRFFDNEKI